MTGQKAEAEDDEGEEDEGKEEGGGTAPPAAASAASDWLGGPNMLAWLASLEKLLCRGDRVTNDEYRVKIRKNSQQISQTNKTYSCDHIMKQLCECEDFLPSTHDFPSKRPLQYLLTQGTTHVSHNTVNIVFFRRQQLSFTNTVPESRV